jgi:hypothetical protein
VIAFWLLLGASAAADSAAPVVFESHSSKPGVAEMERAPDWKCGDWRWESEPTETDHIFEARIEMECDIDATSGSSLARVRNEMLETLKRTRKIHAGPEAVTESGLSGVRYEVTIALKDADEGVRVREEAIIASDDRSRLIYQTRSKEISANGMAAYLRRLAFRAEVQRRVAAAGETVGYRVKLWNLVAIERPWYALGVMFRSVAKGKVRDKFEKVRAELLPRIAESLRKEGDLK